MNLRLVRITQSSGLCAPPCTLITGSALVMRCCKAHARISRKIGNSTPCKTVTPKNFSSKLCTCDYARDGNHCANFDTNRFNGGFSPSRWNITHLRLFFDCVNLSCPFFSDTRPGRTVAPIFTLCDSNDVFSPKVVTSEGYNDRWRHLSEICFQCPLKVGVNRQF